MLTKRREKKSRAMRGSRVCGWGRTGQHRKHGGKGGRRGCGLHKHRWSRILKYKPEHFGRRGFKRPRRLLEEVKPINVGELCQAVDKLLEAGLAKVEGGLYVVDVKSLGYNKVLGEGEVTKPIQLIAPVVTEKAKGKIESAGGKVIADSV
ncbi:MAG: uL15 family ribosomal protein [Candidatus Nezhaarchaeota archaeon]|nr:uL15 family ribosomal protein [Candidatus Nezhaarchaeota archaeon]